MPQPVQYRGMALIVPDNDSEWKEFYEHARAHRLVVRKCTACGLMRYPPTHACPWCMDLGWTWQEVSGRGTIYSYEIVAHAIQPGFKALTPYAVVLIELDEQRGKPTADEALRVIANLVKPDFTPQDVALLFWASDRVIELGGDVAPEIWRRHLGFVFDGLRSGAATPLPRGPLTDTQLKRVGQTRRGATA